MIIVRSYYGQLSANTICVCSVYSEYIMTGEVNMRQFKSASKVAANIT